MFDTFSRDNPEAINSYVIHNMHAIPTAWDLMSWYVSRNEENGCAWNLLGILGERLGLHRNALQSYKRSVSLLTPGSKCDMVLINYARQLIVHNSYKDAIDILQGISEASFSGGCALALAYFKCKYYRSCGFAFI